MPQKLTAPILLFGSSKDSPDLEYISGFKAVDPVTFLRTSKGDHLLVPQLELGRANGSVKAGVEVLCPEMLQMRKTQRRRVSNWIFALLSLVGAKRVRVPDTFPVGLARALGKKGIDIRIIEGAVFPERQVKTSEEIGKIKESQQAAVLGMRAAMTVIAASDIGRGNMLRYKGAVLTSERVRDIVNQVLFDHHCLGRETIVAGGIQATDPHETGSGPLMAHEAIVMDIFPQHLEHGYWGDLSRTVVRGTAPRPLKKLFSAVKTAQHAALNRVKAGVACRTVHREALATFARRGYKTERVGERAVGFIHGTGHGVGLSIHEAPSIGMSTQRLRSGNVITVEPGLYYPDIGGVRIEDTVVVTPTGWRYLVSCEKRLEL